MNAHHRIKVSDVESVFDNGEVWPHGKPVFPEILARGGTKMIKKKWRYLSDKYELPMAELHAFSVLDLLPDETGFLAMKHYHALEAYILNGDASVRFILKPTFNVRGHDKQRLALIKKYDEEETKRFGHTGGARARQAIFHNKTERKDVLEMFGDDGFGDCYYEYDSNTGELLNARALPFRS